MASKWNSAWHLVSRPRGREWTQCLEWRESVTAELAAGEVLVRTQYLSLDPTQRIWMEEADSYLPAVQAGAVMRGGGIGVVEESRDPAFAPGDLVRGMTGWQRYCVSPGRNLAKLPDTGLPVTAWFGLLGHIGLTAYFGLLDVGRVKAGETLVVSAAAGAVGSLVCQIARILGLKVVGIAGGEEKCRRVVEEFGAVAAVDYKTQNVRNELRRHCPNGIDVIFENVGGDVLNAALSLIRLRGRVVLCGLISQYNATEAPRLNLGPALVQRARIEGFIVMDYLERSEEAVSKLIEWHRSGQLSYAVDVVDGLENAPRALGRLFDGTNTGKLIVRVGE